MSAAERILQIQKKQQDTVLLEEERRKEEARLARLAEQADAEDRAKFTKAATERIMSESGILSELKKIEREILSKSSLKHALIYSPEKGKVRLVWGKAFVVKNGELQLKPYFLTSGTYHGLDAFGIEINVNPNHNSVRIENFEREKSVFSEEQWRDRNLMEETLAQAYLNPIQFLHEDGWVQQYSPDIH